LGQCVGSDKIAFYRAYDAAQQRGGTSKSISQDYADPGVSSGIHGAFEVCGTKISIASVSGVSANLGAWHGSTMTIETPAAAEAGATPNGLTPSPNATAGAATMAAKGGFGIYFSAIPQGLVLIAVAPGSRADHGKLKVGQLVTAINGRSIGGMSQSEILAVLKSSTGVTTFTVAGVGDLHVTP
jgi:C-terminal processing protease CtpA/Prc